MIKENEYCSKVIETEFGKPLVMTEKDNEDFNNSTELWICKRAYEEGEVKVKDNNHVTRKYAHQECNPNLRSKKKSLAVVGHNLQSYINIIIRRYNIKINPIPKPIKNI